MRFLEEKKPLIFTVKNPNEEPEKRSMEAFEN